MKHLFSLALLLSLAIGPAGAETLYNKDGVQLSATARPIEPGAATCRIREERHSTAEYERLKPNDGQPLNVWRVEFVVANYSGRVLDYLNAHLNVESDWPPCDNWDGPESSYGQAVVWTGPLMTIHEVGSIQPGEERREIKFVLAWHEDDPVLGRWDINYTFDDAAPASGDGNEPPERQTVSPPSEPARTANRFQPEETCAGKEVGSSCWMELSNLPGCYTWNPSLASNDETVTWTGDCSEGLAQGTGSRTWDYTDDNGKPAMSSGTGELRDGKAIGPWTVRLASGVVVEGNFAGGTAHGHHTFRHPDGGVEDGPYVNGKRHGLWIERQVDGDVWEWEYVDGRLEGGRPLDG